MRTSTHSMLWLAAAWMVAGAGCTPGGTDDDGGTSIDAGGVQDSGTPGDGGSAADAGLDAGLSLAARTAAAEATARTNPLCVKIKPFYWEVGDQTAALGSGSITVDGGTVYAADTVMAIASASKWLYSTYFVQKTNGVLSASDIQFFNFWSGYTDFSSCPSTSTVGSCLDKVNPDGTTNGTYEPATANTFLYSGGHMQKHAALNGLGALGNAALSNELRSQLGNEVALTYFEPQLAGGAATSAAEYAKVLRKILKGQLVMKDLLGTHAVCTDPATCPLAISSPAASGARDLQYHYSIGHWVEDDPATGDGSFSSAGAFGFYPWIDATKTLYGVIARKDTPGSGFDSVDCGRLVRKAWITGVTQ